MSVFCHPLRAGSVPRYCSQHPALGTEVLSKDLLLDCVGSGNGKISGPLWGNSLYGGKVRKPSWAWVRLGGGGRVTARTRVAGGRGPLGTTNHSQVFFGKPKQGEDEEGVRW